MWRETEASCQQPHECTDPPSDDGALADVLTALPETLRARTTLLSCSSWNPDPPKPCKIVSDFSFQRLCFGVIFCAAIDNIAPIIGMNTAMTDKLHFMGILHAHGLHSTMEIRECPYQRFYKLQDCKNFPGVL